MRGKYHIVEYTVLMIRVALLQNKECNAILDVIENIEID